MDYLFIFLIFTKNKNSTEKERSTYSLCILEYLTPNKLRLQFKQKSYSIEHFNKTRNNSHCITTEFHLNAK